MARRFSIIICLIILSCSSDNNINRNYLVFGKYAGFCIGNCIQVYKIENQALFVDTLQKYPSSNQPYEGSYVPLTHNQYEQSKSLLEAIPDQILSLEETVIGQPDAVDQGGYYIEIKTASIHRYWLIDTNLSQVPEFMHDFLNQVDNRIATMYNK